MNRKSSKYGHFFLSDALNLCKETLNCTNENKIKENVTTTTTTKDIKKNTNCTINCFRNIIVIEDWKKYLFRTES